MMRQRAVERKNEEMEVMEVEEEGKSGEESESESEYEEYTDSEDEAEPRLKPVFIRKYELTTAAGMLPTVAKLSAVLTISSCFLLAVFDFEKLLNN